jgi:hypothetical protein
MIGKIFKLPHPFRAKNALKMRFSGQKTLIPKNKN